LKNPTFGDRLKLLREENGMTLDDLTTAVNNKYPGTVSDKSILSRYERNESTPKKITTAENIANCFGVSLAYMMGRSESKYGEDEKWKEIPILGTIAAGIPIAAQEDRIGTEVIPVDEDVDFCLRVKGDSMIGARIYNGDTVFIHKQDEVENGEIAAIQIDGEEATLKRFYKDNSHVILHSENPTIPDMVFTAKDKKILRILGKVKYVKFEAR
jgi:repressor LexA